MKKRGFLAAILLVFLLEAAVVAVFMEGNREAPQDVVAANKIVKTLERNWDALAGNGQGEPQAGSSTEIWEGISKGAGEGFQITVLDCDGKVLLKTKEHLSETISQAVSHRDTILDIGQGGEAAGKVILHNPWEEESAARRRSTAVWFLLLLSLQAALLLGYGAGLYGMLVKPFRKLEGFAERIAGGNLEVPLEMDRQNLFGAFTESFDIMRAELKKARLAEAEANAGKRELVAQLSHDIKTPVASIKAASEVGCALAESRRMKENYTQIIQKADQINTLVTNLFTATLQELQELPVFPADLESGERGGLLEQADYLHRAKIPSIPPCLVWADRLRLQQVFDNIFANSYKYAGTDIEVWAGRRGSQFVVTIEDSGGGLPEKELYSIKEKFRRGSNAGAVEGAGLGLSISEYFMDAMQGSLTVENGAYGLKVTVAVPLSGTAGLQEQSGIGSHGLLRSGS